MDEITQICCLRFFFKLNKNQCLNPPYYTCFHFMCIFLFSINLIKFVHFAVIIQNQKRKICYKWFGNRINNRKKQIDYNWFAGWFGIQIGASNIHIPHQNILIDYCHKYLYIFVFENCSIKIYSFKIG